MLHGHDAKDLRRRAQHFGPLDRHRVAATDRAHFDPETNASLLPHERRALLSRIGGAKGELAHARLLRLLQLVHVRVQAVEDPPLGRPRRIGRVLVVLGLLA